LEAEEVKAFLKVISIKILSDREVEVITAKISVSQY
jgi:hypothetical protein